MRRTNSKRKKPQSNETGGLSFAVTLLAALGTILYAVYIYVQTTPIDPVWYALVHILISAAPILAGGLLLYILIKGYSMEVQDDPNKKMRLKDKASGFIYSITFFSFSVLLVSLVYIFFVLYLILLHLNLNFGIYCIVSLIGFLCIFIFFVYVFDLQDIISLIKIFHSYLVRVKLFVRVFECCDKILLHIHKVNHSHFVGFSIVFVVFAFILSSDLPMLQGHVTVDMESIYYKNDAPIPVLIHVTGPNPILSIELQNSTKVVYNLELTPERNLSKTVFRNNSFLIGNVLNYGTYNVFINTTNLSAGYYELVCKRPKYEKTYGARGFYLLNSSHQSCIKD